jgi:hypothetical protein
VAGVAAIGGKGRDATLCMEELEINQISRHYDGSDGSAE